MTARRVAAVLSDGLESVAVAERAAVLAGRGGQVLGLIPMLRPPWTMDAAIVRLLESRLLVDAAAIAGRVRPVLERSGVELTVLVVRHSGRPGAERRAIRRAARRAGVDELILAGPIGVDAHAAPRVPADPVSRRSAVR